MISVVAKAYGIHPQTLRLYEREGLLKPSRTDGNTRLYSDDDLKQLEVILNLTRELGVNLAGVEIALNMRRKMEQVQAEVGEFVELGAPGARARRAGRLAGAAAAGAGAAAARAGPGRRVRKRRRSPRPGRTPASSGV